MVTAFLLMGDDRIDEHWLRHNRGANGLFSGGFTPPGTNVGLTFRGALLQQRDVGSGFFLNKKVSGKVELGPALVP